MPHILAIVDMQGGAPNINEFQTPYTGIVYIFSVGGPNGFGLYLIGGSVAQLTALNALAQVRGLAVMTDSGATHWAELGNTITTAQRTKLNTWLTARGYPTIPVGWSYRQIIRAIIRRMRSFGEDTDAFADQILMGTWVAD